MISTKNRWLVAAAYAASPLLTAFTVSVSAAPELIVFIMLYAVLLFSLPAFIVGMIQTALLHKSRPFRMAVSGAAAFALCLLSSLCFNPFGTDASSWDITDWPPFNHLQLGIYGVLTAWLLDYLLTAALNRKAV